MLEFLKIVFLPFAVAAWIIAIFGFAVACLLAAMSFINRIFEDKKYV